MVRILKALALEYIFSKYFGSLKNKKNGIGIF